MDDFKNNSEITQPYQNISNRKNPKNFISFRKDVKNNKINNSYCIIETENKKISFDLVDNNDFFDKSNLKINIRVIKEKINPRIKSAKIRTNTDIWININRIIKEKEKVIKPSNLNENNLTNKEITDTIKESINKSNDQNNKIFKEFGNEDHIISVNPYSDEARIKDKKSPTINKNSICQQENDLYEKQNNSIICSKYINNDIFGLNKMKTIENTDYNSFALKNNYPDKINHENLIVNTINKKISLNQEYKNKAQSLTDNYNNNIIFNQNKLKDFNNSPNIKKLNSHTNFLSLNNYAEDYIYEAVKGFNNKNKNEKNNNGEENLDKSNNHSIQHKKIIYFDNFKKQENSREKVINEEFFSSKMKDLSMRNEKNLYSEENEVILYQENMNLNEEVFSQNNKKIIKKTITIINTPIPKIDCENEEQYNSTKRENYLNFNKNTSTNQIDKVLKKNSNRSRGQKSEEKLGTQCNVTIEDNSIFNPFQFCYICDNLNQIDFIYTTETCSHSICFKCLKSFLENRIDHNNFSIKCPIFTCNENFKEELTKNLVSEYHYKQLQIASSIKASNTNSLNFNKNKMIYRKNDNGEANISKNNTNNRVENVQQLNDFKEKINSPKIPLNIRTGINNENNSPTYLNSNIRSYSKKHIVEVNNLDNFYSYNKNKENYCKKCNEPSLYMRPCKSSAKCLNCFTTFCKYCLKPISHDHFDLNSFNYCKVYFRRKLNSLSSKNNNLNKFKNGVISFLMIIASYLILFMNCFYFLSKALRTIVNIDAYGRKINNFFFVNKNNYKKYENIKTYAYLKKGIINKENLKEEEISSENREEDYAPKLNNNIVINVNKKDFFYVKQERREGNHYKNNNDNMIDRMLHVQIENKNLNVNSFFADLKLLDKRLLYLIKSNIEIGRSLSDLRLRRVFSNPDNRGVFYFYDIYESENHLDNSKKRLLSMDYLDYFRNVKHSLIYEDVFILKIFRYFVYYVLFLILGPILLFILLFIIPYFPLLILIFQI